MRAALDWYVADNDVEAALRLGAALMWFWYVRGYQSEGRWRFVDLLGHAGVDVARVEVGSLPRSHAMARVLLGASLCFDSETSQPQAVPRSLLSASVYLFRELNDAWDLGLALWFQAGAYYDTSVAECIVLLQQFDDPWSVAFVHMCRSSASVSRDDLATARVQAEQGLRGFRDLGDRWGIAFALRQLGEIAAGQGDGDVEFHSIEESVKLRRETGDRGGLAASLQQ